MHTLTPTLLAAGKAASAEPFVSVRLVDAIAGVPRWSVATWRPGSGVDIPHDAALFGDGSVLRVRSTGGTVSIQRTIAPAAGSSWGSFSALGTSVSGSAVACDAAGLYGVVVADNGTAIEVMTTADATTWAGWSTVGSRSSGGAVAIAQRANGDRAVFWADGNTLAAKRQTVGVWDASATTDSSFDTITGIAARHDGADWRLIVTGTDADGNAVVWRGTWGDGGLWTAGVFATWDVLWTRAGVSWTTPHLTTAEVFRLTFVEDAPDGVHIVESWLPGTDWDNLRFRAPVSLPGNALSGAALAGGSKAFRFGADRVEGGTMPSLGGADVSASVVTVRWTQRDTLGGRCEVTLEDNAALITARVGQQVEIAPGYVTASGPETTNPAIYWVERLERCVERGRRVVRIVGRDAHWLLDRETATLPRQWAAGDATVTSMIQQVAAEAGVVISPGSVSTAALLPGPAVVLPAGASTGALIDRLLRLLPDRLIVDGSGLRLTEMQESSVYTLGGDHPIRLHITGDVAVEAAALRLIGTAGSAWKQDDAALALLPVGHKTLVERGWDDPDGVDGAAAGAFDDARRNRVRDVVVCHPCVGLEVWDVVTVDGENRRILNLETVSDRRKGTYDQTLTLGAV